MSKKRASRRPEKRMDGLGSTEVASALMRRIPLLVVILAVLTFCLLATGGFLAGSGYAPGNPTPIQKPAIVSASPSKEYIYVGGRLVATEESGGGGGGNQAPTVSISEPFNGQTFTAPASITVTAQATDNDGAISKVEFFVDGGTTPIATDTIAPYTTTWSGVGVGGHAITAKATDNLQATASAQVSVSVNGGCTPPTAPPPGSLPPDTVWVEDAIPTGAIPTGSWVWDTTQKASGAQSHTEPAAASVHQHYFNDASVTLTPNVGDKLVSYVLINPCTPPQEIMLQWWEPTQGWDHRAFWGTDLIGWGVSGTPSRFGVGALPASGVWVRLEVPAASVGLEGKTISGMAFTLYDGQVWFDRAGKTNNAQPTPQPPSGLVATAASSSQINLQWVDNSNNETGFKIERGTDGINFSLLFTTAANVTAYQNTGLPANTTYHYRVRATNSNGDSTPSNSASATTQSNPPPVAPSNLSATAVSPTQINLSWIDNSNNETGFKIERGADGLNFSPLVTTAANVTTYQNTGLTPNTTYYYRVKAANGNGDSTPSNTANATTIACTSGLAPTGITVAPGGITGAGIAVTSNCAWTAGSSASWIVIRTGSAGTGNGTVTYDVLPNPGTMTRSGTMTIAGQTFFVFQEICSYSIQPTSRAFSYTSDQDSVLVSAQGGCPWTAVSNAPWITINSGSSGTGSNTVLYSVSTNTSTTYPVSRTGTMTIAGQTLTVTQSGQPSCPNSAGLSCDSLGFQSCTKKCFLANGGFATVYVWLSRTDCDWAPRVNVPWIHITGVNDNGSNPRTITYSVDASTSALARVGVITINGLTHTVTEAGTSSAASGRVTNSSGQGLAGATITFSALIPYPGLPAAVVTDANGNWTQSGFVGCKSNIITPSKSGYTFTPSQRGFTPGATNMDFAATQQGAQTPPSQARPAAHAAVAQASAHDHVEEVKVSEVVSGSMQRIVRSAPPAGIGILSCLALAFAIRRYRIRSGRGKQPPED